MKCGNTAHSEQFIKKARIIAKDLFDQTDYEVANGFSLMAAYFFGNNERNKASYYSALAYKICENLNLLDTSIVGRNSITFMGMLSEKYDERLRLFTKLRELNSPAPAPNEITYALVMHVQTEVRYNPAFNSHYIPMLALLDEAESYLVKCGYDVSDFLYLTYQILIYGCRAGVFWQVGIKEYAIEWAAKTTRCTKNESFHYCSSLILTSLEMAIQVHYDIRNYDLLQDDIRALQIMSKTYPIADVTLQKYSQTTHTGFALDQRNIVVPQKLLATLTPEAFTKLQQLQAKKEPQKDGTILTSNIKSNPIDSHYNTPINNRDSLDNIIFREKQKDDENWSHTSFSSLKSS